MTRTTSFSSLGTSIVIHAILLGAMGMYHFSNGADEPDVVVESVFEDERQQEEFSKELVEDTEIAETQNFIAGGAVSTAIGGSGAPAVAQQKVDQSETLKEVEFAVNPSTINLPGENMIGTDLGVGEVNGEVGAVVEGYGAALSRLTQELIRMMRQQKVMVVWLFDESESMKDDQKEISTEFHKVYEELGIQAKQDKDLKKTDEILKTAILSFGKGINTLTKKATTNINEVRGAIDRIAIDESGAENMCSAIGKVIVEYGPKARSQKRQLIVVVVSDESPSDDAIVEDTIQACEKAKAPVYILGREATFGYPYARVRWKDPVYSLWHWVRINRGPETAYPECLQWDGLHARHDSQSSGFGPYSQVRIAKETGGIYFMLPGEEEDIVGRPALIAERKYAALAMKPYEPLLLSRKDYEVARNGSDFRKKLWDIIVRLNPHLDGKLNMNHWRFPIEMADFRKEGERNFERAAYSMTLLNQAIKIMGDIRKQRAAEDSSRIRAMYDLIDAQLLAYRVRLFQYMLSLDDHAAQNPKPKDPKHNRWQIHGAKAKEPTEDQFKRIKTAFKLKQTREEYLTMMKELQQTSIEAFDFVIKEHPDTPWAARAKFEKSRGWGFGFHSVFHDPRYSEVGKKIKIPNF